MFFVYCFLELELDIDELLIIIISTNKRKEAQNGAYINPMIDDNQSFS